MNRMKTVLTGRQYLGLLGVIALAGFAGGLVSSRIFSVPPVQAQTETEQGGVTERGVPPGTTGSGQPGVLPVPQPGAMQPAGPTCQPRPEKQADPSIERGLNPANLPPGTYTELCAGGNGIYFKNSAGFPFARLFSSPNGGALEVYGAGGAVVRVSTDITVPPQGLAFKATDGRELGRILLDKNGFPGFQVGMPDSPFVRVSGNPQLGGQLELFNAGRQRLVEVTAWGGAGRTHLYNSTGNLIAGLGGSPTRQGDGFFALFNQSGKPLAEIGARNDGPEALDATDGLYTQLSLADPIRGDEGLRLVSKIPKQAPGELGTRAKGHIFWYNRYGGGLGFDWTGSCMVGTMYLVRSANADYKLAYGNCTPGQK